MCNSTSGHALFSDPFRRDGVWAVERVELSDAPRGPRGDQAARPRNHRRSDQPRAIKFRFRVGDGFGRELHLPLLESHSASKGMVSARWARFGRNSHTRIHLLNRPRYGCPTSNRKGGHTDWATPRHTFGRRTSHDLPPTPASCALGHLIEKARNGRGTEYQHACEDLVFLTLQSEAFEPS